MENLNNSLVIMDDKLFNIDNGEIVQPIRTKKVDFKPSNLRIATTLPNKHFKSLEELIEELNLKGYHYSKKMFEKNNNVLDFFHLDSDKNVDDIVSLTIFNLNDKIFVGESSVEEPKDYYGGCHFYYANSIDTLYVQYGDVFVPHNNKL